MLGIVSPHAKPAGIAYTWSEFDNAGPGQVQRSAAKCRSKQLGPCNVVFPPVVPVHPSSRCALTCVISGSIQALCPAPHCEIAAGCHGSGIAPLWLFSRRGSLSYVCMLCSRHLKIDSNGYRRRGRLQAPAEYVPDPPCICKCRVISSVKPKAVPVLLFFFFSSRWPYGF